MAEAGRARARLALRWRLSIWIALAFAVAVGVVFAAVWFSVTTILENDAEQDLSAAYLNVYGRALLRGSSESPEELVKYPFPVAIYDATGALLAANDEADTRSMRLTESDVIRITIEGDTIEETVDIRDEQFRLRAGSLRFANEQRGILQVGRSTEAIREVQQRLTAILAGGAIAALAIVALVGYWLARSALRPVDEMTRVAADIEASDLTRRIGANHEPAEVQRLADTFDAMLARLESAFGQQRNFVMDVSHELRTPLTGLRGNIDVMLMDPGLDSDTRAQLEKMSVEVSRLIRLTSNLLYLAHAEAGREIARRPVELDDLCLEVVHQEQNVRRDVNIRMVHEEAVSVEGDRDLLKQLLLNIVDNAVKFSPDGGQVTISLASGAGLAEIAVEDQGPGIPEADLLNIFERFYRGAQGGSRTAGGAGIGLSISRWIAKAHGGDIRAENISGGGSRFTVVLPAAQQEAPLAATLP